MHIWQNVKILEGTDRFKIRNFTGRRPKGISDTEWAGLVAEQKQNRSSTEESSLGRFPSPSRNKQTQIHES